MTCPKCHRETRGVWWKQYWLCGHCVSLLDTTASHTPCIYLIGSLRNEQIPAIATQLREAGYDVFDDWYAAGPEADDYWQQYEKGRGRTYAEAIQGLAADHVFRFDLTHIRRADCVVLCLPAGKSAHMELGYAIGIGKPGYILLEEKEPERFDVMYKYATAITSSMEELLNVLSAG